MSNPFDDLNRGEPFFGALFLAAGFGLTFLFVVGADASAWRDWRFYLELCFPLAIGHFGFWQCKPKSNYGRFSLAFFMMVFVIFSVRLLLFKYRGFDPFGSW